MQWGRIFMIGVAAAFLIAPAIGFRGSLALLTALGFTAAFFGYGRPALGVLGLTLLCTIDPMTRHYLASTIRWNTFNYFLLAVMVFSPTFLWRVGDPHSKILKVFIALMAIQLVISPAPEEGIQHLLGIVSIFGLMVFVSQAGDDPDLWYMVGVVNGLAGAIGGCVFLLLKSSLPYMNPNAWALFPHCAIFCICLGFTASASRPGGQLILGSLATINATWAFLSGSRGGILISLVGMAYLLFSMKRTTHRIAALGFSVAIVLVALNGFSQMEDSAIHRITKMMDDEESAAGRTSGRSDLALAAWHMVKAHPLGVGTGAFGETWAEIGFVPGFSGFKRGEVFPAHAAWAKVLAENGWPGMLLLMTYVASFTWSGMRTTRPGGAAFGMLVTAVLCGSFFWTEFQGKAAWLLAAGAATQIAFARRRSSGNRASRAIRQSPAAVGLYAARG